MYSYLSRFAPSGCLLPCWLWLFPRIQQEFVSLLTPLLFAFCRVLLIFLLWWSRLTFPLHIQRKEPFSAAFGQEQEACLICKTAGHTRRKSNWKVDRGRKSKRGKKNKKGARNLLMKWGRWDVGHPFPPSLPLELFIRGVLAPSLRPVWIQTHVLMSGEEKSLYKTIRGFITSMCFVFMFSFLWPCDVFGMSARNLF